MRGSKDYADLLETTENILRVTELKPEHRRAAIRHVCSEARDGKDAARLLEMLGLNPREGR